MESGLERKALIVDDEDLFRGLMREYLVGAGWRVFEAGDGEEALEIFGAERPPLVFLDIRMPRKGGMETLREMRELEPGVLVVIITASPRDATRDTALAEGAFEYLTKPLTLDILDETLARIEAALGFGESGS